MADKKREPVYVSSAKERLTGLKCPKCGASCDGWTGASEIGPPRPEAGDFSACAYCGTILIYTESFASYRPLSLRIATEGEVREWEQHTSPMVQWVVKLVRRRMGKRQHG